MDLYGAGNQTQMGFNTGVGGMPFGMNQQQPSGGNFLGNVNFGGPTGTMPQQQQQPVNTKPSSGFDLLDNLDDFGSMQQSTTNQSSNKTLTIAAIQDGNISVVFTCNKVLDIFISYLLLI